MTEKEEIKGQQGFKEQKPSSEEIITKEETMFKIGPDGKALPEKYSIYIYDHNLDKELIEESMLLMGSIKKQKAISKILEEYKEKQIEELEELKKKIESEKDKKIKIELQLKFTNMDKIKAMEEIKEKINVEVISSNVKESREIIQKLNELKEKQKQKRFIELIPCTSSEAYLAFEKGKTIDNKETNDWVADLISKRCHNPKYTFVEAKILKPDYKIAIKNAIMEASDYKIECYRDIMLRKQMEEEKPLTLKKGQPIE